MVATYFGKIIHFLLLHCVDLLQFGQCKIMQKRLKPWCSSESASGELSNECQHDGVKIGFGNLCVPVLWTKVAFKAFEGLPYSPD